MRIIILILASFFLASCVPVQDSSIKSTSPKVDSPSLAKDASSIISNKALVSYKSTYIAENTHKAFAQSTTGAWAWAAGRTSMQLAMDFALERCRSRNIKREHIYPCKIINIDDKWETEFKAEKVITEPDIK